MRKTALAPINHVGWRKQHISTAAALAAFKTDQTITYHLILWKMFKKAGHLLFLLHAHRLIQVSSWSRKAFLLPSRYRTEFEGNNPAVCIHIKKYWRYSGTIPQPFKPTCVGVIHATAFSQAFPPSILLQHQYVGNESTQNRFGWNTDIFFGEICLCSHLNLCRLKLAWNHSLILQETSWIWCERGTENQCA